MSVNKTHYGSSPAGAANAGQAPQAPRHSADDDVTAQLFGWSDIQQNIFGTNINTGLGSSFVLKAMEAFNKIMPIITEQSSKVYDVELIRMDPETYPVLPCSVVLVAVTSKTGDNRTVAYQPLLIEATYDANTAIATQEIGGVQIEVLRLAANSYGPHQQRAAAELIAKRYPERGMRPVTPVVMPSDFDLTNDNQVTEFLSRSILNTISLLNSTNAVWKDISLESIAGNKTLLTRVRFATYDEPVTDPSGVPVRSDVRFALTTLRDNQSDIKPTLIAEPTGYMDLVYYGSEQQFNPQYGMMQKQPPFVGRFNITSLSNKRIPTLGGALLTLGATLAVYQQNIGMMSLFPNRAINLTYDPRNIGILNLEANINNEATPSPIEDIRSSGTSDADIFAYMSQVIRPTFQLALEILESNSESAINLPFLAAARGVKEARRDILVAADQLTGGYFFRNGWDTNDIPVATISSVIPVGDYDPAGGGSGAGRRDTRDCDLLTVMNAFGMTDYSKVRRWSNARLDPNMPWQLRLAEQRAIINDVLSEVRFRDVATQVLFDSRFLAALSAGLSTVGVNLQVSAPMQRVQDSRYIPQGFTAYDPMLISGTLFSGGQMNDNRNQYYYGAGAAYQPVGHASTFR